MKKVYEPLPMIMNGRYAVLFGKMSEKEKKDTLTRMAELIEEEHEYEDKGNYGNLHNIDFIRTRTLCQGGDCCDFRSVGACDLTARQSTKAACPAILMKNETGSPDE